MTKHIRVLLVLIAFAPVMLATGLPALTAGAENVRIGGVPITMLLLALNFLLFVVLSWCVASQGDRPGASGR